MPVAPRSARPRRSASRTPRKPDTRRHSHSYGRPWRRIRSEVLAAHGIPRDQWHRYHVDHRPAYDPAIEPDHRKYDLVPMLAEEHNRKTAREDGGFGNSRPDFFSEAEGGHRACESYKTAGEIQRANLDG